MKIKMNTLCAGPAGIMEAGKTYDVDPDVANNLVAGGYATLVEQPSRKISIPVETVPGTSVETTALKIDPEPQQAVQPRPTRRKKS